MTYRLPSLLYQMCLIQHPIQHRHFPICVCYDGEVHLCVPDLVDIFDPLLMICNRIHTYCYDTCVTLIKLTT